MILRIEITLKNGEVLSVDPVETQAPKDLVFEKIEEDYEDIFEASTMKVKIEGDLYFFRVEDVDKIKISLDD